MQDLLNRFGLTLQFISLWMVTPEIIGEERILHGAAAARSFAERTRGRASGVNIKLLETKYVLILGPFVLLVGAGAITQLLGFGIPRALVTFGAVSIPALWILVLLTLVIRGMGWIESVLRILASSRHRLLIGGGVLFTIGYILLMWATWLPAG